jgi:ATP-binding cassette subfamily F protein 3
MADTSADAARLDLQREGLDTTLSDVHSKLAEMESDKAEPRAASIFWRMEDEAGSCSSTFL